ncbi:MAG: single-stranded DNA-binding protein [Oscillospiraceae bacterium]|nr:MAG: single-stranded DNA-binding protein [Oscillospiraceae bacterium]
MYNRVIMIGRLVADPELRTTPNGINVASLRIAVDRPYSKNAEKKSDFFNVVAWRQNAEFISRYFSKGRLIGIEGSLQTRDYTDKEGNKRTAFEIQADRAFFTESKSASSGAPGDYASPAPASAGVSYASGSSGDFQAIDNDDDLPF